jgi:hypothetical protein
LPTSALDEVHTVVSPPLKPTRVAALDPDPSTPDPSRVTLAAPVVGPLLATSELTATGPKRYEKAAVRLSMCSETVAPSARIAESPAGPLPSSAVSDTQQEDSSAVPLSAMPALRVSAPAFEPSSVTLVAPVGGPFVGKAVLAMGPTNENAAVTELTRTPSEATQARDAPAP